MLLTFVYASIAVLGVAADDQPRVVYVGDAAPKLEIKEFVRGEPVKQFEAGKTYVVVFWNGGMGGIDLGPVPHLTSLQEKYKDVVFLGITTAEYAKVVRAHVAKRGGKVEFRVAIEPSDERGGKMQSAWRAYWPNRAYVVNRTGRLAWIGDSQDIEEPLKLILADKWDLAAKAAEYKEAIAEQESAGAEENAEFHANEELDKSLAGALRDKRYDDALKLVEQVEDRENLGLRLVSAPTPFFLPIISPADTRTLHLALLSISGKEPAKAVELGKKLLAGNTGVHPSAPPTDQVIAAIVTPQEILDSRRLGFGMGFTVPRDETSIPTEFHFSPVLHLDRTLAKVAAEAADGVDSNQYASGFDTRIEYANRRILLARIYQAAGEKDKAVAEVKKATAALQVVVHDSNKFIEKAHALEHELDTSHGAEKQPGK